MILFEMLNFSASVALVKSRDLHWTLAMQRDNSTVNLKTLRMMLVADGSNPCEFNSLVVLLKACSCFKSRVYFHSVN